MLPEYIRMKLKIELNGLFALHLMYEVQGDMDQIPNQFLCPISCELMINPVMASDGQTYEKNSIKQWFNRGNRKSPLTGKILTNLKLSENIALKKAIQTYKTEYPQIVKMKKMNIDLEVSIRIKQEFIQEELGSYNRRIKTLQKNIQEEKKKKQREHQAYLNTKRQLEEQKIKNQKLQQQLKEAMEQLSIKQKKGVQSKMSAGSAQSQNSSEQSGIRNTFQIARDRKWTPIYDWINQGKKLKDLKVLKLIGNSNQYFQSTIDGPNITKIQGLESLTQLKQLYLCQNQITKIENLQKLGNLQILYLRSNRIQTIENLQQLTKLHTLNLSSNLIKKIENLDKVVSLTTLNLYYNKQLRNSQENKKAIRELNNRKVYIVGVSLE